MFVSTFAGTIPFYMNTIFFDEHSVRLQEELTMSENPGNEEDAPLPPKREGWGCRTGVLHDDRVGMCSYDLSYACQLVQV